MLNRETIRVITADMEIDFDKDGNIVSYRNLEDFSTVDKDKRVYDENEINTYAIEIEYEIIQEADLNDTIDFIETANELQNYKIVNCSNEIEGSWVLTWCKDYGNDLINSYECVNVVVDAEDGSIMLFGKNEMVPNTTVPTITKEQAIKFAESTILQINGNESNIVAKLSFFRPNYYWEGNGLYESSGDVRLTWEIDIGGYATVQIDALSGENLGGGSVRGTDCARAMGVVPFEHQNELTQLASAAFTRLGYNQANYAPVTNAINQADIDWMLSRPDVYGLYLACHGGIVDGVNVLADTQNLAQATWQVWSNNSFGNWHFVFLDACLTSANLNFANAFRATSSGRCFVGWNISINNDTVVDFDRRFFPRLGSMSVYDAVITSLWESRNAGFNSGSRLCNPGFAGDHNYYGWAW